MKLINIRDLFKEKFKEYIFGSEEIEKSGVYLVYGEAKKGEIRKMGSPGHEEILLILEGKGVLENKDGKNPFEKEQVAYLGSKGDSVLHITSDCKYVVAGGHTEGHHH